MQWAPSITSGFRARLYNGQQIVSHVNSRGIHEKQSHAIAGGVLKEVSQLLTSRGQEIT